MMTRNARILFLGFAAVVLLGWMSGLARPADAAALLQLTPFPTPTPGADGRILYIVQPGDTLWRISAVAGVSVDELRGLNQLGANDVLQENQQLLLGIAGPAQAPTQQAVPTPTSPPAEPTPDAGPGTGEICVLLFNDANGDTLRQDAEFAIVDAIVSVSNRAGTVALTGNTFDERDEFDNPQYLCFPDLVTGEYNITVAIPDGYNPTTVLNYALQLDPGNEAYMDFAAQISTQAIIESPPVEEGGQSPILGLAGLGLVGVGIVLAIFVLFSGRSKKSTIR